MNIENIFPEISYFIKNPKRYELLYYKDDIIHNEYALDVEEAERIMNCLNKLQQENQQLKLINEEYERLNKENGRGFTITSVQKYDIYELLKYKDNWNELKDFLEINWKETQDIWFVKIINKMEGLERGESDE